MQNALKNQTGSYLASKIQQQAEYKSCTQLTKLLHTQVQRLNKKSLEIKNTFEYLNVFSFLGQ